MDLRARIGIDLGRKLSVEEGIAWAAANDVRYVDAQIDLPPNALSSIRERAPAIRSACREHGVNLGLHTLSAVNIAEVSPFVADAVDCYLKTYMDMAVATGASWVVVHAGYHFTDDYQLRRDAALERLGRAAAYAEKVGARLALENMNREPDTAEVHYLASTIEECRDFFGQLTSPSIEWSFTVNHAHLYPEGIDGFLEALPLERCGEVRIADCYGTVEEHLKPGTGFKGHYTLAFGSLDDMLEGREYLLRAASA
jgi:sugar phosphate isomerase/epimerase